MKRKRYEVRGMMEWHPVFRIGRTRVKVGFTGGHLCGGGCTPASFETADPVLQKVIEGSETFRSGRIVIAPVIGAAAADCISAESPRADAVSRSASVAEEGNCVFEFGNVEEICDFLHYRKGVPLERFDSEESIFREAERLGVTLRKKNAAGS